MYFDSFRFELEYDDVQLELNPENDTIIIKDSYGEMVTLGFDELEEIAKDFEVIRKYRKVDED
jgi:hypothetical protein